MQDIEYRRMREAEDSHWWYVALHELVLEFARSEKGRLGRPLAMLDAGCGTGRLCELLSPFGEVTGCDIHPLAIEAATRRGVGRVLRRDVARDDLGDEEFDLITVMDVLYHRMVGNELAAFQNLRRALRPGGLLLLQVPALECLRGAHDLAVHTRRRYRRREVVRMLRGAGFRNVWATCRLLPLFPVALVWRILSRVIARLAGDGNVDSDVRVPPPLINRLLLGCMRIENRVVAAGCRLPLGTSVFAVAWK